MSEKKYSYLPNKYTIKFFKLSNEGQQKSFKPLLITDNLNHRVNDADKNDKEYKKIKFFKNKSQYIEIPLYSKNNYLLIQKRKKAINAYLNTKKNNICLKGDKQKKKYINNNHDSYSSSSFSKTFNNNQNRVYHTFQNSKTKKKKSNIISQIKNKENENDNKIKKKLNYCKTDKDFHPLIKEEKISIHNNSFEKNVENKIITKNSVIIKKSNSENKINFIPKKCKSTEQKNKTIKNYVKDISMKDNCFNIDNFNKNNNNNIKVYKASLLGDNKNLNKNLNKNDTVENKKERMFKPNMDIFKNTKINIYNKNIKFLTEKNINNNHEQKLNNHRSDININNNNNIIKNINNNNYYNEIMYSSGFNKNNENNKNDYNNNNYIAKNNSSSKSYISNNRPLNIPEIYKSSLNPELSQFTFKKQEILKDNNQSTTLLIEKRKNELKKLINFTNKF